MSWCTSYIQKTYLLSFSRITSYLINLQFTHLNLLAWYLNSPIYQRRTLNHNKWLTDCSSPHLLTDLARLALDRSYCSVHKQLGLFHRVNSLRKYHHTSVISSCTQSGSIFKDWFRMVSIVHKIYITVVLVKWKQPSLIIMKNDFTWCHLSVCPAFKLLKMCCYIG